MCRREAVAAYTRFTAQVVRNKKFAVDSTLAATRILPFLMPRAVAPCLNLTQVGCRCLQRGGVCGWVVFNLLLVLFGSLGTT